jgi:hypothetical protein
MNLKLLQTLTQSEYSPSDFKAKLQTLFTRLIYFFPTAYKLNSNCYHIFLKSRAYGS